MVLDPFTLMIKKPGAETQLTALAINLQNQGNTTAYAPRPSGCTRCAPLAATPFELR
ncbi:hypothetical protein Tamer19_71260 [Cupriavidus sp. TA19]|nr:hypothetical protein Tamer19_71260 [Cupriavidus sp. TA19]